MKKLIEFLLSGCWHEWETIKEQKYENSLTYDSGRTKKWDIMVYTLRCKNCGEIKSTKVSSADF